MRKAPLAMVAAFVFFAGVGGAAAVDAPPHFGAVGRECVLLRIDRLREVDARLAKRLAELWENRPEARQRLPLREILGSALQLPAYQQYLPRAPARSWIEVSLLAPITPGQGSRTVFALRVADPESYKNALASRPGYEEVGGGGALTSYRVHTTHPPGDWHLGEAAGGVVVFSDDRAAVAAVLSAYNELRRPELGRWPPRGAPDDAGDLLVRRHGPSTFRDGDLRLRLWGAPFVDWPDPGEEQDRPLRFRWASRLVGDLAADAAKRWRPPAARALAEERVDNLSTLLTARAHRLEWTFHFGDDALRASAQWRAGSDDGSAPPSPAAAPSPDDSFGVAVNTTTGTGAATTTGRAWMDWFDAWMRRARAGLDASGAGAGAEGEAAAARYLAARLPGGTVAFHALAPGAEVWRGYIDGLDRSMCLALGGFLPPAARAEVNALRSAWENSRPGATVSGWIADGANGEAPLMAGLLSFGDDGAAGLPERLARVLRPGGPMNELVRSTGRNLVWEMDAAPPSFSGSRSVFGLRAAWIDETGRVVDVDKAIAAAGVGSAGSVGSMGNSGKTQSIDGIGGDGRDAGGAGANGYANAGGQGGARTRLAGGIRVLGVFRDRVWHVAAGRIRPGPEDEAAAEASRLALLAALLDPSATVEAPASPLAESAWTTPPPDATRPGASRCIGWFAGDPRALGALALARGADWRALVDDEPVPPSRRELLNWTRRGRPTGPRPPTARLGAGAGGGGLGLDLELPWPSLYAWTDALGLSDR